MGCLCVLKWSLFVRLVSKAWGSMFVSSGVPEVLPYVEASLQHRLNHFGLDYDPQVRNSLENSWRT